MKIRWGILGVANINRRLIPGFKHAKNAELAAIASRSFPKALAAAKSASIPKSYGSYEALLDDPEIDAVYLPLPNHLHSTWARKAAERGKHILCEKPLAPTAKEALEIVDFCRSHGVRLMDGFMWPHHPRTAEMRQVIDDGVIGEVMHVNASFTFQLDLDSANIRLQQEMGGGSLLDVGCYPVYGIRWAFDDEPQSVWATARIENGVDLSMSGVLKFAGGRTGSFDCGFTLPFRGWMEVCGTIRTMRIPDMWLPPERAVYEIEDGDRRVERSELAGHNQIARMIEELGAAIVEKREPVPSAEEAVRTLSVLDALAQSAREGREVPVTQF
jgi:predicted dehydrogenase